MQTKLRRQLSTVLMWVTGLMLTACSREAVITPKVSASRLSTQPPPIVATEAALEIKLRLITDQPVAGVFWAQDGQTIIYAEEVRDERGSFKVEQLWHALNVVTGEQFRIEPPVILDSQIWTQIGAVEPFSELFLWFRGVISPGGTHVIYSRIQPGYTTAGEFDFPPIEIWIAKLDGTEARRLGGPVPCSTLPQVIWFNQEEEAIIECSYEGPPNIYLAGIEDHSFASLGEVTTFTGSNGFGSFDLSSDGTKLAITDLTFTLQIVPLDGSKVQPVAQWAYMPKWSSDSQRVYYQQGQRPDICDGVDIHVYDLTTGTDTVLVESPLSTSDDLQLNIACGGPFEVSPREKAVVIWTDGLWLVEWSR